MGDADPDHGLLDALRSKNAATRRAAEHDVFARFHPSVDRLMRRMLGRDADDCVQEALVDVFRGLPRFEGRAKLSTWVYRVALRRAWKCAAQERRDRRRTSGEPIEERAVVDPAPGVLAGAELARRFAAALEELDLDQRTVMALSAVEGLDPSEIAEVLGVPVGTVHSRTSRARARLRRLLGIGGEEPARG